MLMVGCSAKLADPLLGVNGKIGSLETNPVFKVVALDSPIDLDGTGAVVQADLGSGSQWVFTDGRNLATLSDPVPNQYCKDCVASEVAKGTNFALSRAFGSARIGEFEYQSIGKSLFFVYSPYLAPSIDETESSTVLNDGQRALAERSNLAVEANARGGSSLKCFNGEAFYDLGYQDVTVRFQTASKLADQTGHRTLVLASVTDADGNTKLLNLKSCTSVVEMNVPAGLTGADTNTWFYSDYYSAGIPFLMAYSESMGRSVLLGVDADSISILSDADYIQYLGNEAGNPYFIIQEKIQKLDSGTLHTVADYSSFGTIESRASIDVSMIGPEFAVLNIPTDSGQETAILRQGKVQVINLGLSSLPVVGGLVEGQSWACNPNSLDQDLILFSCQYPSSGGVTIVAYRLSTGVVTPVNLNSSLGGYVDGLSRMDFRELEMFKWSYLDLISGTGSDWGDGFFGQRLYQVWFGYPGEDQGESGYYRLDSESLTFTKVGSFDTYFNSKAIGRINDQYLYFDGNSDVPSLRSASGMQAAALNIELPDLGGINDARQISSRLILLTFQAAKTECQDCAAVSSDRINTFAPAALARNGMVEMAGGGERVYLYNGSEFIPFSLNGVDSFGVLQFLKW